MFKKVPKEKKTKNKKLLRDSGSEIKDVLLKDMDYEECLSSIFPMSYENPFEEHQSDCELVSCSTSDGFRMGFFVPRSQTFLVLYPNKDDSCLDCTIAFLEKHVAYSSGLSFDMDIEGDLYKDAEKIKEIIDDNKNLLSNMLWLLMLDENKDLVH
jgi:hypothetical protein